MRREVSGARLKVVDRKPVTQSLGDFVTVCLAKPGNAISLSSGVSLNKKRLYSVLYQQPLPIELRG